MTTAEYKLDRYRLAMQTVQLCIKEIEQHCPCGARPESLKTHPHVTGCPVERALLSIKLCKQMDW